MEERGCRGWAADRLRAEAGWMVTSWKAICAQSFQGGALLVVVVVTAHMPSWILATNLACKLPLDKCLSRGLLDPAPAGADC